MDDDNKKILEYEAAKRITTAVSDWMKRNHIDYDVNIHAAIIHPTLYLDDNDVAHTGPLTMIDVSIDNDDDDEY